MKELNHHLTEYLNYYVNNLNSPGFAVLLNGPWGCGKTHFIETYIKKNSPEQFLYFSLIGSTNAKDARQRMLLAALKPSVSEDSWSAFSGALLEAGDVFNDNSGKVAGLLAELIKHGFKKAGEIKLEKVKVFILDDLERTELSPRELLGLINEIVEHVNAKVILIADENKLHKKFRKIKEKVIGQSLSVIPDYQSSIEHFLNNHCKSKLDKAEGFCKIAQVVLKDTHNLRTLRMAIQDFDRIYENHTRLIDDICTYHSNFDILIFAELLVYRNAFNNNQITCDDIRSLMNENTGGGVYFSPTEGIPQLTEQKSALEKIGAVFSNLDKSPLTRSRILSPSFVNGFIINGFVDSTQLNADIEKSYYSKKETPDWLMLAEWRNFSDFSFLECHINRMLDKINSFEVMHPGEFLHVVGALLNLYKSSYPFDGNFDVFNICREYIKKVNWEELEELDNVLNSRFTDSWASVHYLEYGDADFLKIIKLILNKYKNLLEKKYYSIARELPDKIKSNPENALDGLYFDTFRDIKINDLSTQPILVELDVNEFVNSIWSLSVTQQNMVILQFSKRYAESERWFNQLSPELTMLKDIVERFTKISSDNEKNDWLKKTRASEYAERINKLVSQLASVDKGI